MRITETSKTAFNYDTMSNQKYKNIIIRSLDILKDVFNHLTQQNVSLRKLTVYLISIILAVYVVINGTSKYSGSNISSSQIVFNPSDQQTTLTTDNFTIPTSTASSNEFEDIIPYKNEKFNLTTPVNQSCFTSSDIPPLLSATSDLPLALQNYIKFHKQARECLFDLKCKNKPDIIIWTCAMTYCGGIGDRIRYSRFATLFAMTTGRLILVDWPKTPQTPYEITSAMVPSYIDWTMPKNNTIYELMGKEYLNASIMFDFIREGEFDNTLPDAEETGQKYFNLQSTDFKTQFKNYSVLTINPRFFCNDLNLFFKNENNHDFINGLPTDISMLKFETYLTRMLYRPSKPVYKLLQQRSFEYGTDYIGVHLRTGFDHTADDVVRFKYIQGKGVQHIARHTLTCIQKLNADTKYNHLFVASDGQVIKEEMRKQGEALRFKVATGDKKATFHLDIEQGDRFGDEQLKCTAYLEVYADMFALASAKRIVYLYSGFPRAALNFGNIQMWHEVNVLEDVKEDECLPDTVSTWSQCKPVLQTDPFESRCWLKDRY